MFDLERAWNCNMRLKFAVKRAALDSIPKQQVVNFWRTSARKLGYWGSYPNPLLKKVQQYPPTRNEIIFTYSINTGMFGSYAAWQGLSVSYFLKKAGYAPLSESEQKRYRTY